MSALRRRRWLVAAAAALLVAVSAGLVGFRLLAARQSLGSLAMASGLDLHCTLPVVADGRVATISLPDGAVTAASARMGAHDMGQTYIGGHWLPVMAGMVSPDGGSYAFVTWTSGAGKAASTLYVHDIRSGRDRALWTVDGQADQMPTWTSDGIYLNVLTTGEMWVVDPAHPGSARMIGPKPPLTNPDFGTFGGPVAGAAWALSSSVPPIMVPPAEAPGPGQAYIPVLNELLRMDVGDGTVAVWAHAPAGMVFESLSVDASGHPLLGLGAPTKVVGGVYQQQPMTGLLWVTGRDQAERIAVDATFAPTNFFMDRHGIWLTGKGELWLFRGGRLAKVATSSMNVYPVGPCT